jgi:hypothetical protein
MLGEFDKAQIFRKNIAITVHLHQFNFILLSPCICTNSIYFTLTNADVKPLFL